MALFSERCGVLGVQNAARSLETHKRVGGEMQRDAECLQQWIKHPFDVSEFP